MIRTWLEFDTNFAYHYVRTYEECFQIIVWNLVSKFVRMLWLGLGILHGNIRGIFVRENKMIQVKKGEKIAEVWLKLEIGSRVFKS